MQMNMDSLRPDVHQTRLDLEAEMINTMQKGLLLEIKGRAWLHRISHITNHAINTTFNAVSEVLDNVLARKFSSIMQLNKHESGSMLTSQPLQLVEKTIKEALKLLSYGSDCQNAANEINGFMEDFRSATVAGMHSVITLNLLTVSYSKNIALLREVGEDPTHVFQRVVDGLSKVKSNLEECSLAVIAAQNNYLSNTKDAGALRTENNSLFDHARAQLLQAIRFVNTEEQLMMNIVTTAKSFPGELSNQFQTLESDMKRLVNEFTAAGSNEAILQQK